MQQSVAEPSSSRNISRIYAIVWCGVGFTLMLRAVVLWMEVLKSTSGVRLSFLKLMVPPLDIHSAIAISLALALYLGHLKGRGPLKRAFQRFQVAFAATAERRIRLRGHLRMVLIIAVMMMIARLLKQPWVPRDIYAFIDLAVGSGLFQAGLGALAAASSKQS